MAWMDEYWRWRKKADMDAELAEELRDMAQDEAKIEDAFYRNLAFGTGGLRGILGAGTNRMNVYTVAKASQGLADYVKKNFPEAQRKIAVSYDSRVRSDLFAETAAGVFAANGIRTYIYRELMPTPCLSYAVRALGCAAGVMVTASHNPAEYNGYKAYGADGCQVTVRAAEEIQSEIGKLDIFEDAQGMDFQTGMDRDIIRWIADDVYTEFIGEVKKQSVLFGEEICRDFPIVYTPLNGTGLKPVLRALKESGFCNVTVVKEQEQPDGSFPTCPYPNPEAKEAMALGMEYAKRHQAELLLATDPDCDRAGIAVRDESGEMRLLSGNETGMLLLDYICSQRVKHGKMPEDPVFVKTVVTAGMAERIAAKHGVRTISVLTGFKYIGEQIGRLEALGKEDSYIFGFEESYGYLSGSYVRDKDAVGGACLICEMSAYYRTRGISLLDRLEELYGEFGHCLDTLHSYAFEGPEGFRRMRGIMGRLRQGVASFGGKRVVGVTDYSRGIDGLPASDVLKFSLEDDCSVVVRPSGTEPKLKAYLSVSAEDRKMAEDIERNFAAELLDMFMAAGE